MKRWARSVLVTLLALAVLAALLWYGDVPKVVKVIERFRGIYTLWFFCLILAHEIVRGLLWHILLDALALRVPLRTQIFTFAASEVAKVVPLGAYLQNYLLQRSTGSDFGRSSAATTVMILGEIAVALVGVAAFGLGIWSGWLRLAVIVGVVVVASLGWAYLSAPHASRMPRWIREHKILVYVLEEFRRFRAGAATLLQPRLVAVTLALCALYVFLNGAALYIVVLALGVDGVSFWQAEAVNSFGLAFYVVLGSLEAAEVGVLIAIGVSKSAAVSIILVNRALSAGITIVLAALVMAILHDEARTLRRPREAASGAHRRDGDDREDGGEGTSAAHG